MIPFIKQQERKLALRLLMWYYQKHDMPVPDTDRLRQQANRVVDDAHRIARERGSNVVAIIRELIAKMRPHKS